MRLPDNSRMPQHLPRSFTPFVGRQHEYTQIIALLCDPACHLVSISGPGGVGKTRLALEAAGGLGAAGTQRFSDGIFFVSLSTLQAHESIDDLLAAAIASALSLPLSGEDSPSEEVRQYLRERATLLVLDNAEHLLTIAPLLSRLLQDAPSLVLLVTSREPLHMPGEWNIILEGLQFPSDWQPALDLKQYDAVELFSELARMQLPDFALTPALVPAVLRICKLVAGLPLGIELAASWLRVLSCADIADELERSSDTIRDSASQRPERQRSLRALFDSSWQLLTADEQQA